MREDELMIGINALKLRQQNKAKTQLTNNIGDKFDEYIGMNTKKAALKGDKPLIFGYGRKNPNKAKRRK